VIDLVTVVEPDDVQAAIDCLGVIGYVHQGDLGVEVRDDRASYTDAKTAFVTAASRQ
jgi:hypothetical protein